MKVVTIVGTRPEIIRLSRVIPLLDRFCTHSWSTPARTTIRCSSDVFFERAGRARAGRAPGRHAAAGFAAQVGEILPGVGEVLAREQRPDRVLILGDTNSGLAAIVAARMGIPVFHMEAGNRCYDDRVPEEINRRVIDHSQHGADAVHRAQQGEPRPRRASSASASSSPATRSTKCSTHYAPQIDASDALARFGVGRRAATSC